MKVYSIGRELGCDIIINDSTDVISRRHATLNVLPSGKMTIIDLSHNGTYVNGIRINQNVPVPVTREDNISFAHVAHLDWDQIPDTRGMIIKYSLMGLLAILLVVGGVWGCSALSRESKTTEEPAATIVDSLEIKKNEEKIKEAEQQKMDSIKKHVQDSLNKAHQKSKEATKKNNAVVKKTETKKESPKKEAPKKEEPKQKRFH